MSYENVQGVWMPVSIILICHDQSHIWTEEVLPVIYRETCNTMLKPTPKR